MSGRQAIGWVLCALWLTGCSHDTYALYQRLPEEDKELFARSKQFLTDDQQERFLLLKDSAQRRHMIDELHIQERLARFPDFIQQAIMAQRVVPGMTSEALLLSWGKPSEIDRRDLDGVPSECWYFRRGSRDGQAVEKRVYLFRGLVTEIVPPE